MIAGIVAAGVYELVHIEMDFFLKVVVTLVAVALLFIFGTAVEFWIQSSIDPDVPEGWGP